MRTFTGLLVTFIAGLVLEGGCGVGTTLKSEPSTDATKAASAHVAAKTGTVQPGQVGFIKERDNSGAFAKDGPPQYAIITGPLTKVGKYDLPNGTKFTTVACGDQQFTYVYRVGQDGHHAVSDHRATITISGRIKTDCADADLMVELANLIQDDAVSPGQVYYEMYKVAVDYIGYIGLKRCFDDGQRADSETCQASLHLLLMVHMYHHGRRRIVDFESIELTITEPATN